MLTVVNFITAVLINNELLLMIRSRNILLSLKPLKYSVIFKTSLILTHRMSTEIEEAHLVICAERKSMPVDVQEGKTYYWCSCGRSTKQPFCDGK